MPLCTECRTFDADTFDTHCRPCRYLLGSQVPRCTTCNGPRLPQEESICGPCVRRGPDVRLPVCLQCGQSRARRRTNDSGRCSFCTSGYSTFEPPRIAGRPALVDAMSSHFQDILSHQAAVPAYCQRCLEREPAPSSRQCLECNLEEIRQQFRADEFLFLSLKNHTCSSSTRTFTHQQKTHGWHVTCSSCRFTLFVTESAAFLNHMTLQAWVDSLASAPEAVRLTVWDAVLSDEDDL